MVRKANEQSLGSIIENLIKELSWSDKINQNKIMASWEKIMGNHISKYTEKIVINKDVLIIYLKSAPLREELKYAKSKIIENINKEFESEMVKDIVFR